MMTIGSLFSGIGGLELGLERAGLGPVLWQCELDPFCREVLAKHWPNVTRFDDVTRPRNYPAVDLLCGGFPCQGNSSAGNRRGLKDPRSALWFNFAAIIGQLRPKLVVVENVASGAKLWLPTIGEHLRDLGYRARAFALSAAEVGAPHLRRRIFVVAHASGEQLREQRRGSSGPRGEGALLPSLARENGAARDADRDRESALSEHGQVARMQSVAGDTSPWASPPEFRGVDDGVPRRLDRLRTLGNAVVPQCAEVIGRMILEGATAPCAGKEER